MLCLLAGIAVKLVLHFLEFGRKDYTSERIVLGELYSERLLELKYRPISINLTYNF